MRNLVHMVSVFFGFFGASHAFADRDVGSKATAKEIFGSPSNEPLQVPSLVDKKCGKPFVPISEELKKAKKEGAGDRGDTNDEKTAAAAAAGLQSPPQATPVPVLMGTPASSGKSDCGQPR